VKRRPRIAADANHYVLRWNLSIALSRQLSRCA
jgi:hypothetical protein